jgi:hypothetical protein
MPLRRPKPESQVLKAAAAQESTIEILNSVQPKPAVIERRHSRVQNSFIEDVELWVKQYLSLADEVLHPSADAPAPESKNRAA